MKLHQLSRSSSIDESLTVSHNVYKHFLRIWHFHEEYELVLINQSSGMRFVGDDIEKFEVGDLVLIGKNLPHMWLNDKVYFDKDSKDMAEAFAFHFKRDFLGASFLKVPEMLQIGQLLELAERGIKFESVDKTLINDIKGLIKLDSVLRISGIIGVLHKLSKSKKYRILSSSGFVNNFNKPGNQRLEKMYEYVFQNFNSPIGSCDVAEVMFMNKSAFSRFFKKTHQKSFTKYLNEIRIGYACKLLMGGNEKITSICYLSGFNNVSNFNRQFKLIKKVSPSAYLQAHKSK